MIGGQASKAPFIFTIFKSILYYYNCGGGFCSFTQRDTENQTKSLCIFLLHRKEIVEKYGEKWGKVTFLCTNILCAEKFVDLIHQACHTLPCILSFYFHAFLLNIIRFAAMICNIPQFCFSLQVLSNLHPQSFKLFHLDISELTPPPTPPTPPPSNYFFEQDVTLESYLYCCYGMVVHSYSVGNEMLAWNGSSLIHNWGCLTLCVSDECWNGMEVHSYPVEDVLL